jgi:hypothetical protein
LNLKDFYSKSVDYNVFGPACKKLAKFNHLVPKRLTNNNRKCNC